MITHRPGDPGYQKARKLFIGRHYEMLPQAILEYQTATQYFERYLSEAESAQHMYAPNARRLHKACVERARELREQEAKDRDSGDPSLEYEP